jgi:hypothetical protein
VRGNQERVAVHRLKKPLDTLKLRIVARAVRENSTPPRAMVREIEAFSEPGDGPFTTVHQLPARDNPAVVLPREPAMGASQRLWFDDFSLFRQKDRHYEGPEDAWVFNPRDFSAKPTGGRKGLLCTSTAAAGYSAMGRLFPHSPEFRYFQVRLSSIEGEGYRWFTLIFGDPSGKLKSRTAVHTLKPGLYTVDTHALNEGFRTGALKQALVQVYLSKNIQYSVDWLGLNRVPRNGLVVSQADGTPLPVRVKQGDELLFRLYLDQPADDALVELLHGPNYEPARINGEPYVQLLKSGREKDGRFWSALVKLGPGTDKFKLAGYPLLFRCVLTGGRLRETMVTCDVNFE